MPIHEDEHPAKNLQLPEARMAQRRSRSSDSQGRRQTHRKNVGVELI